MDPVTASLTARLQAVPESASSPLEQQFRQEIVPQIEALLKAVGAPDAADVEQAARLWKPLRQICNSCGKVIRCAYALECVVYIVWHNCCQGQEHTCNTGFVLKS